MRITPEELHLVRCWKCRTIYRASYSELCELIDSCNELGLTLSGHEPAQRTKRKNANDYYTIEVTWNKERFFEEFDTPQEALVRYDEIIALGGSILQLGRYGPLRHTIRWDFGDPISNHNGHIWFTSQIEYNEDYLKGRKR